MLPKRYLHILLLIVVLFTGLLIVRAIVLYFNPSMAANAIFFSFSLIVYIIYGIIGCAAILMYRKRVKRKISIRHKALLMEGIYKNIVEDSGVSGIIVDTKGIIRFMSKNIERLSGFISDELIGMELITGMPAGFRHIITDMLADIDNSSRYGETIQVQIYTKPVIKKWISFRVYPIKDREGQVKELQLMVWDIDKEKKLELELKVAEQAQKAQQKLLQTIIDYSPSAMYLKNRKGEYILTNAKLKQINGTTLDEELSFDKLYTTADKKEYYEEKKNFYREQDLIVMNQKRMVTFEDEFIQTNGKALSLWLMKFPIFDEHGEVEYVCGFSVDITTLKQSEKIILDSKKEAEKAKEAQEVFLANMSHEIRTPMNGIIGMTNLLLDTTLTSEQKDYMGSIQESARNLLLMINDLLDFSKIKSGKFNLDSTIFEPRQLIKNTMYPLLFKANEKGIPLKCLIDPHVPQMIKGDPLRLQQMIINLVSNAIKFTDRGFVEVKVYPISQAPNVVWLGIDVTDTGIGIDANKLDYVFESYTQSDKNTSRLYGGTGLGLAIVKQLADIQNGTVSVKSKKGEGSVFTLNIPYHVVDKTQVVAEDAKIEKPQTTLLDNIKILVVEDNPINQKVVKQTLLKQNALVDVAANGVIAIKKLQENDFDIILMDLQMPEMDGYAATEHIRQVMHNNIPIIAMTADAMNGEMDKCINMGMNAYISKPFEPKDLYNNIRMLMNRA